jgi:hypothetical protein
MVILILDDLVFNHQYSHGDTEQLHPGAGTVKPQCRKS